MATEEWSYQLKLNGSTPVEIYWQCLSCEAKNNLLPSPDEIASEVSATEKMFATLLAKLQRDKPNT